MHAKDEKWYMCNDYGVDSSECRKCKKYFTGNAVHNSLSKCIDEKFRPQNAGSISDKMTKIDWHDKLMLPNEYYGDLDSEIFKIWWHNLRSSEVDIQRSFREYLVAGILYW